MTPRNTRSPLSTLAMLAALIALTGLLIGTGCAKKDGGSSKANKLDCNKLCDKTFDTCVSEVLLASGKMNKKKLAMFKKLGLLKKVKKQGHEECLKGCRAKSGQFSDARSANACLDIADCTKFAKCITGYIK